MDSIDKTATASATRKLCEFLSAIRYEDIPRDVVLRLNKEINGVLAREDMKSKLAEHLCAMDGRFGGDGGVERLVGAAESRSRATD